MGILGIDGALGAFQRRVVIFHGGNKCVSGSYNEFQGRPWKLPGSFKRSRRFQGVLRRSKEFKVVSGGFRRFQRSFRKILGIDGGFRIALGGFRSVPGVFRGILGGCKCIPGSFNGFQGRPWDVPGSLRAVPEGSRGVLWNSRRFQRRFRVILVIEGGFRSALGGLSSALGAFNGISGDCRGVPASYNGFQGRSLRFLGVSRAFQGI